ncbi:catalase family peroxidase [Ciceribacter sp. L1K23]|uniref:catalase family peroxidase n=1 Tax=Ciceribacter sp. L1K23 TaxID=2820276 RepID=UPI001B836635|nr:catalase family peroxidase [Ciceribacter sp. L1K23]
MNSQQYRLASQLVDLLHRHIGFYPGHRSVHAQGRYYAGVFTATPEARRISRAAHFQGQPVPVTIRHSNSPLANPVGPADSVSMAVRFYLPDGTATDLIALPITLFFTRTPEETLELLTIALPDPETGKPDMEKVGRFLAERPSVMHAVGLRKQLPAAVSFARTAYHALHAFRFVNDAGDAVYARYHWEPDAGVATQTLEELRKEKPSYLFEELEERLSQAPVGFTLVLELAGDGDPTDDPSAPWPEGRPRITVGRLEITRPTTLEEIGDPVMMHDPTRVTDGIELSDDPILAARRGIYEVSVAHRTGGWKGRSALLQRGGCPFG